jgi:glycosyltransferase involved in cell wall biosynthesis
MEMRIPKVSVGLPVYNGEKYLVHALARLQRQEFEDFELIISDNASTDRTQEICREFADQDPRIRYSRNAANIGLAANHNRAFAMSRGPYFKWVSHDDDFPPAMLGRFVSVLEESPATVSVVYSHCEYIDETGRVEGADSDGVDKDDPWPHRRLAHLLENIHMYNCPYGLIRSDLLRATRLHGLFFGSDHVLFAELAMLGSFVEIPEPLLRIRRHPGRTYTTTQDPQQLREMFTPGKGHRFPAMGLRTRMKLELIRSAALIPTRWRDKLLCTAVAAVMPQWRTFRAFGGRQKQKLLRMRSPEPGRP